MQKYLRNRMIIIDSIIILFMLGYFLSALIHRPYMHITIEYKDIPPVSTNLFLHRINVHYRGYSVGYVHKIELSEDQQHIEFKVNIMYKNLRIPKNSIIVFKPENLYGSRYLDISYPESPSRELLNDGDVIKGIAAYESVDQYLLEDMKTGKTGQLINNLVTITDEINKSLKNKDNAKLLNQSAGDVALILENTKNLVADKKMQANLKNTIKYSSNSFKAMDAILSNEEIKESINKAPETISKSINTLDTMNTNISEVIKTIPEMNQNMSTANKLISDVNGNLSSINTKVPEVPSSLIKSAQQLIQKTDCFETELSKILSKRGVLLRFMFGSPGKSLKKCSQCKIENKHDRHTTKGCKDCKK